MVKSDRPDRSLSGLLQSVRNQATPWREKIKVAHKLLSNEYYLPNKHQIILDWACQELINNSTKEIYPNEMLKELWEIITEILKFSNSMKVKKSRVLSLRSTFIEVLTKEFQSTNFASVVLTDCCKLIFSKVDIYKPLVVKFEKYVQFLANVLRCLPLDFDGMAEKFNNDAEEMKQRLNSYLELADALLQLYLKLQKQQPSLRKVSIGFNEKLLKELVVWRTFLAKYEEVANANCKVDFETVIRETLWHRENLEAIKGHLHLLTEGSSIASTEEQKSRKFALLDSLFTTVEKCIEAKDEGGTKDFLHESMLLCIPEVYQTFLKANRYKWFFNGHHWVAWLKPPNKQQKTMDKCLKQWDTKTLPPHFEFSLFKKLSTVAVGGVDALGNEDESVNIRLSCIVELLKLLVEFNVFKINDDAVNSEVNNKHLDDIARKVTGLLDSGDSKTSGYQVELLHCIKYLIEIDRSLVEDRLKSVVQELLLRRDCGLEQDKKRKIASEKDKLLCFLLDMYAKSRQTRKFLELLMSCLIETDAEKEEIIISETFLQRLEQITKTLPIGQMLSILEILINEISSHYLNDIYGRIHKLNILSEVLSIFALNIHMLSSNGYIGKNQEKFLNLVKRMHEDIVQPIFDGCAVGSTMTHVLKTAKLELAWKFINTLQRISLFLLHHGMISSPLQKFVYCNGKMLPSSSWERISLPDVVSENFQCLEVTGVILQARIMILMSNDKSVQECCSHLKSVVTNIKQSSRKEEDIATKARIAEILLKDLPWLGEHLSDDTIKGLCEIILMSILARGKANMKAEKQQDSESSTSSRFIALLCSSLFYDSRRIQTIFCKVFAMKIRTLLNNETKRGMMLAFEKILNIESIEPESVLKEPLIDDHDVIMNVESEAGDIEMEGDSRTTNNGDSELTNEVAELDSSALGESTIKSLCNEILLAFLVKGDQRAIGNAATGSDYDMDEQSNRTVSEEAGEIEKVLNMMKFEWLLPENAVKLMLAILLLQSEGNESTLDIFSLLVKVTSMTITANRIACWKIMDPASLLRFIMCQLQTYADQGLELPVKALECVHNLWTLVLNVKRQKTDFEVTDALKDKMVLMVNKVIHQPDLLSVELMNELLLVVLEVLQSRVIKKHALSTAITFVYPIAEELLSIDPANIFGTDTSETATERPTLLSLKSYGYVFAICILMKKSGKNQQFMSLIKKSNLQSRIISVAEVVKTRLSTCSETVLIDDSSRYEEEIYLEFLDLIGQFGGLEDITHLQTPEFCQSVFSNLLRLVFRTDQDPKKEKNYSLYYKVMAQFINESEEVISRNLLEEFIQNMRMLFLTMFKEYLTPSELNLVRSTKNIAASNSAF